MPRTATNSRRTSQTVTHWVRYGVKPCGSAGRYLAEALSRRLGRTVTLGEIGLIEPTRDLLDWRTDTLSALADLGRIDTVDMDRRRALGTAAYSLAGLALPGSSWWDRMAEQGNRRRAGRAVVGRGDLDAVRDMAALFSTMDQRHGGGHARTAVVQYLVGEVSTYLNGTFTDDQVRRGMYSTASELAYLSGWMAFDNGDHPAAQKQFTVAVKLAAEADDAAMAAHVIRAMAHQANDLGHSRPALALAAASVDGKQYRPAPANAPSSGSSTPAPSPRPGSRRPPPTPSSTPKTTSPLCPRRGRRTEPRVLLPGSPRPRDRPRPARHRRPPRCRAAAPAQRPHPQGDVLQNGPTL
ncbi:hypothetical protein ACQEVM_37165 [Streptomyces sp. CA-243310]|uniref:hypothetical protein n=1 Tax=Streptomyces sp. CA-243310 TaxID=3240056 RepID=UPI003D91B6F5